MAPTHHPSRSFTRYVYLLLPTHPTPTSNRTPPPSPPTTPHTHHPRPFAPSFPSFEAEYIRQSEELRVDKCARLLKFLGKAKAGKAMEKLYHPGLSHAGVTNAQAVAMAEAMVMYPVVASMDLRNNLLSEEGILALLEVMKCQRLASSDVGMVGDPNNDGGGLDGGGAGGAGGETKGGEEGGAARPSSSPRVHRGRAASSLNPDMDATHARRKAAMDAKSEGHLRYSWSRPVNLLHQVRLEGNAIANEMLPNYNAELLGEVRRHR